MKKWQMFGEPLHTCNKKRSGAKYAKGFQTLFPAKPTRESRTNVDAKVEKALEKLRNTKILLPPQLLKLQPLFSVVKASTSLLLNLVGQIPNWPRAFADFRNLVKSYVDLNSWDDDYAFAEVHNRLGWDLRSLFRHDIRLEKLFGKIQDDAPNHLTEAAGA